jgi:GT2 family glycosyltransferase
MSNLKNNCGEMKAFVVVIVATYRRAPQLRRLLDSLEKIGPGMGAIVIVDNGDDTATRSACDGRSVEVRYFAQKSNIGCGGGLRLGEETAFELYGDRLTHLWILDDDAVVPRGGLDILLGAMEGEGADAASPMLVDEKGRMRWYAGLLDPAKFLSIRRAATPEEYIATCGDKPVAFSWATGISLLVSRRAVEDVGFHRADFWVRGEDLEFSLRITARYKGILVPRVSVEHLIPTDGASAAEYIKQRAHLQNIFYTALHLSHGRRIASTLPGNFIHFLGNWRWTPRTLFHAARAFWLGAVLGQPAGTQTRTSPPLRQSTVPPSIDG